MSHWLSFVYLILLGLLILQAWRCIACVMYIGPFNRCPKPRTTKEKQNEFIHRACVVLIALSTFSIVATATGG